MAAYKSHHDDEFSTKKYAVVGAVKELFDYHDHGHGRDDHHDENDVMYKNEKLYGSIDKEKDDPFKVDYLKREETDEFGRPKLKPSGVEEKLDIGKQEKYKAQSNDEIAEVLFQQKKTSMTQPEISDEVNLPIADEEDEGEEGNEPGKGSEEKKRKKQEKKTKSVDDILGSLPWKKDV